MTSTLQGESRQQEAGEGRQRDARSAPMPKACITSESGRDEASRRAFCILS